MNAPAPMSEQHQDHKNGVTVAVTPFSAPIFFREADIGCLSGSAAYLSAAFLSGEGASDSKKRNTRSWKSGASS